MLAGSLYLRARAAEWSVVLGEGQGQFHHKTPANGGDQFVSDV